MADDPAAAAVARLAAQTDEYSEYVATEPIFIDGARAFNAGDPVPKSHVTDGVVNSDQVARVNTKAAKAVTNPEG